MNMVTLVNAIVEERTQRILDLDEAYPDVGMGMSYNSARRDAITQLKREGILPQDYKE